jgi:hypothetical protein
MGSISFSFVNTVLYERRHLSFPIIVLRAAFLLPKDKLPSSVHIHFICILTHSLIMSYFKELIVIAF